jgi:hypothetical protein
MGGYMGSLTEDPAFQATTFVVIDFVIRAGGVSSIWKWLLEWTVPLPWGTEGA